MDNDEASTTSSVTESSTTSSLPSESTTTVFSKSSSTTTSKNTPKSGKAVSEDETSVPEEILSAANSSSTSNLSSFAHGTPRADVTEATAVTLGYEKDVCF